jgi:hypothetical protein
MDFSSEEQRILHFQVTRLIVALFKNYLFLADDIQEQHQQMLEKIEELLPDSEKDKLDLVDYFDEAKYNYIRKRILDLGNDAKREFENILGQYDIEFKDNRLGEKPIQ